MLRVLFFQAAQPRRQRAAPDPHPAARQPHHRRPGSLPAPAVESRPGHPQLGDHLIDRQQRVARGSGCFVRGWRRAGRERLAFPGAARPWVRDDGRSAPPAPSSPAPAGPATADDGLGQRGNGKGGKAASAGAHGLAGGLVLPEGKAGRTRRGIPDGGRRHTPAGRWPAERAGLPPGTAGINPHLSPPGQVRPAPVSDGLDTRPRATGRYGQYRSRTNKGTGQPWAGHREGGTVARARAARATVALALRAGGQTVEGVLACRQRAALSEGSVMDGLAPLAAALFATTEIRFSGAFHALPENRLCKCGRPSGSAQ